MQQLDVLFIGLEKSAYFGKNSASLPKLPSREAMISQELSAIEICVEQYVVVGEEQLRLKIWNPSGQESYTNLRELSFYGIDSIIVVFFADEPTDCQSLQAYYQQIRRTNQRRNIEVFIVAKVHRNNESFPSLKWLYGLTAEDSCAEVVHNEAGLLERVARKCLKKLQKERAKAQKCINCAIY